MGEYWVDPCGKVGKERKGVAVLLGWAGVIAKHLSKYADIWKNEFSYDVVFHRTSVLSVPPTHPRAQKYAEELAEFIKEHMKEVEQGLGTAKFSLVFHVFSNGGLFIFLGLNKFTELRGDAVIIDSAPAKLTAISGARALTANYSRNSVVGWAVFVFIYVGLTLFYGIGNLVSRVIGGSSEERVGLLDYIYHTSSPKPAPVLYLYSKDDKISDSSYIDATVVRHRKFRGDDPNNRLVSRLCFSNSPHCDHFRRYPKEYVDELHKIVNKTRHSAGHRSSRKIPSRHSAPDLVDVGTSMSPVKPDQPSVVP